MMSRGLKPTSILSPFLLTFLLLSLLSSSQRTCPRCGTMEVPYPLSTNPSCGDPNYSLLCDPYKHKLHFNALNGSTYLVLRIQPLAQRMVLQPSPLLPGTCITQDMPKSEGLWLNQSLPFNVTSSNTIFFFNCSPRLLISPLNCTTTSLCHRYLEAMRRVDPKSELECASGPGPCCTFIAGGMPSAYQIRLHSSGCRAFRSVLHLDPERPPSEWEEGLEIQWASPPEPTCRSQNDCSQSSSCSATRGGGGVRRCLCNKGYHWDGTAATCLRNARHSHSFTKVLIIKVVMGVLGFFFFLTVIVVIMITRYGKLSNRSKIVKERENMIKASGRSARMFGWKEVRKATKGFSKETILGSGGFGEVYKGVLEDGTPVAVKSAKVGNLKSTQQVLNEVGILSLVNHKNLVRLLGCCVESQQPLMIYEYIPNGTLYKHLHMRDEAILDWKTRLKIALQTAEALAYLHSSAHVPIYHRDVKSTNILLDQELNAKVSDFGLSRLAQPGLSHVSTCAQGTLGYLDPEYYRNYQLTDKSDVYSFGVVLLELLTSKKVIDFSRETDDVNLAEYVKQRAKDGAAMEVIDKRLFGADAKVGVLKTTELFLELSIACLREKKEERPCMKEVAEVLQYIIETLHQEEFRGEE
ncbi:wall-associated receptor kinase-like 20 [Elaeis guineensis]|uniref:wall-associated receptor kinase-like 20 n=1 Tax=Elaeis guineensis var. tenera TaxID=51953 RepID=UPI003C6D943C